MILYFESYDYIWRKCIQFQSKFLLLYDWIGQWEYTCNRFSQKERKRGHTYNCERIVWLHWQCGSGTYIEKKFIMWFSIFFDYAELGLRNMNFKKNYTSNTSTITLRQWEKPKSHNKSLAWGKVRSSLRLTIYTISCHTFPSSNLPLNDLIFVHYYISVSY